MLEQLLKDKSNQLYLLNRGNRNADLEGAIIIKGDINNNVADVKEKAITQRPAPPFTTSTLQQEASKRLGFSSRKTMSVAQQLYEGVEIQGQGQNALVSYIRTDSVRVSEEASSFAREHYTVL